MDRDDDDQIDIVCGVNMKNKILVKSSLRVT